MENFRTHLVSLFATRNEALTNAAMKAFSSNPSVPPGSFTQQDARQLVGGMHAIFSEILEERGKDTYAFYLETVVPSMVAQGESVASMMYTIMFWVVLAVDEFSRHSDPKFRDEIID